MSTLADATGSSGRLPQPGTAPEELRAAVRIVAPALLPTFDAERDAALRQARDQLSAAPIRRFTGQWATAVAIERHPERAARYRELEERAAIVEDLAEARHIAAELGRILDAATAEVGIKTA